MKTHYKILLWIGCLLIGILPYARADEQVPEGGVLQDQITALQTLKAQDPQAFQEKIDAFRKDIKEKLIKIREDNPSQFQSILQEHREDMLQHLQDLRKDHPDKFQEAVENHRQALLRRASTLKAQDPAQYKKFIAQRAALSKKLRPNEAKTSRRSLKDRRELKGSRQNALPGQKHEQRKDLRDLQRKRSGTSNDERFQHFLANHPKEKERWEHADPEQKKNMTDHFRNRADPGQNRQNLQGGRPPHPENLNHVAGQKPVPDNNDEKHKKRIKREHS